MSSYKPLDSRQVINRAALSNIGSPAGDNLADILALINAALSGITGNAPYVAKEVPLTSGVGTTSYTATISSQPDISYVVFAMFENLVDSNPQFQTIEVISKTTTGFVFEWNIPLSSNNYIISYIVVPKNFIEGEISISGGSNSSTVTYVSPQQSGFGVIASLQNITDINPQFQPVTVTTNSSSEEIVSFNAPTSSGNYLQSYFIGANSQVLVGNGINSATLTLPINYGTTGYGVVATMQNLTDVNPQFQPIVITGKTDTTVTFSWNVDTLSGNYAINCYTVSLTA